MADDDVGLLFGDGLRKGRKVGRRDRKDDLVPGAAGGFDCLLVVGDRGAAADAVERHADDLAAFLDVLTEFADRLAGDLEHHAGAVGERLRRRQRVADAAERRHHRHADLTHLGIDRPLRARQTESEDAEHLVTLGLFLGSGHGAVGFQAVVVEDDVDLLAVDAAAVVERLDVELETLPGRRVGARPAGRKDR